MLEDSEFWNEHTTDYPRDKHNILSENSEDIRVTATGLIEMMETAHRNTSDNRKKLGGISCPGFQCVVQLYDCWKANMVFCIYGVPQARTYI
jgi:hypothetical protein